MDINNILARQIYENEVLIAEANQDISNDDYESYLGIINNVRDEKNYDWQSDIRIPEFVAHALSQSAMDVSQYFSTRDFVEVKINDASDEAKNSAEAAKELINRTLNKKSLYHYQKFVRAKGICNLIGKVYLKCWWDQKFEPRQTGTTIEVEELDVDINGLPITEEFQQPALKETEVPVIEDVAVIDCFNYDVWDQRNVFESDEYVYSLQEKSWIVFRSEKTKAMLEDIAELNEYFDIDKIGEAPDVTDTKEESYQKKDGTKENMSKAEKFYDVYERYGKYWVIEDKDTVKPGIDEFGEVLEDATYEEVIITFVADNSSKTLIGFKKTNFIDANGLPYKPCIRGLCYVHPSDDGGMGDGQNVREIQTAIDDTFNASQDRVILSTFPVLKVARQSLEDNSSIQIAPGQAMELLDVNDVQEFRMTDNVIGALNQLKYLEDKGRQVDSQNETTTGGVPSIASTTATAVNAAAQSSNIRINYKSMTFEHTVLLDLYWMIQQMTYMYATEETGLKLLGDKLVNFDPTLDYYYTPLSQSIETESSKVAKRREWMQLLQVIIQIQHPDAVKIINFILKEVVKLMGDEYENVVPFDESTPVQQGGQQGQVQGESTSNQYGMAQSQEEAMVRANAQ